MSTQTLPHFAEAVQTPGQPLGVPHALPVKRVIIMIRVSKGRDEMTTAETQEQICRSYCSTKHDETWQVIKVIHEIDTSGWQEDTKRPQLDWAMRMIETQQADAIVVFKLDRFERRLMRFMGLWERIKKAGGVFVSVTEQFDTTTWMGELMLILIAGFAQGESQMKSDRMLPFHAWRSGHGLPPTGPRPYGYQRERQKLNLDGLEKHVNNLVIDPDEAAVVRSCAQAVLAGVTLRQIGRDVEAKGVASVKPVKGKPAPMTVTGIKNMLTSPTTAGLRKQKDGSLIEGIWEPILTRPVWEQVCAILGDPKRKTNYTDGKPAWLLSGIMTCARPTCRGYAMVARKHQSGKRYICRKCNSAVPQPRADEAVSEYLLTHVDPQAWKALKTQGRGYDPAVIAELEAEAMWLVERKIARKLTPGQFDALNDDLQQRMAAAHSETPLDLPDVEDLQTGWKTLDLTEKRVVVQALLNSVSVTPWDRAQRQDALERIMIDPAA